MWFIVRWPGKSWGRFKSITMGISFNPNGYHFGNSAYLQLSEYLHIFTLFFDGGTASLWCSFNNQGTGEGHELLNTKWIKTARLLVEEYFISQSTLFLLKSVLRAVLLFAYSLLSNNRKWGQSRTIILLNRIDAVLACHTHLERWKKPKEERL